MGDIYLHVDPARGDRASIFMAAGTTLNYAWRARDCLSTSLLHQQATKS